MVWLESFGESRISGIIRAPRIAKDYLLKNDIESDREPVGLSVKCVTHGY